MNDMSGTTELEEQIAALRDRLSRLSEASLRINESLDFEVVLQGVLDSACSLVGAHYGVMTILEESGGAGDFLSSGLSSEEARRLWVMPGAQGIFEYLANLSKPLRVENFSEHLQSLDLSGFLPPVSVSAFLTVPMRHIGDTVGNIYVAKNERGQRFSGEDEDTLAMFAAQAAMVIANARRHRDEQRARTDLETLIDTSPVGVVVFDTKTGMPLVLNREVRRIMDNLRDPKKPTEHLLSELTIKRSDGREFSLAEVSMTEALSANETVRAEEIVMQTPDGRSIRTLLNATPIRSDSGEVESFVVTLQDLTPIDDLERLRAEFLGMVSHELRTPLSTIRGSATTMLDAPSELDPAELRQFLRIIVDQSDNMRDLIGSLLDVARIDTGTLPVDPQPSEMAALVDRARNTYISSGGRNALDIDIAPNLPLVMADSRRVVQVIGNLLSNAARHSPQSASIRVSAARDSMDVAVTVADQGSGIPAEQLPRLFRKFTHAEAVEQPANTGLGLAICKGIVEAHGGRIWAESGGPGQGARFTFTIPAAEETAPERLPPPAQASREPTGEPILVVDDDPQMLRYVRNALSNAGYAPMVTADPQEALRLMREERPHIALLDMMLPGADGIDLMRDIFGIADVPVIFLSAYGHEQMIARAFETGATDYIVKPFSPTELVARVRAALRRRDAPYQAASSPTHVLGDLAIDYAERLVTVAGNAVQLTATEYDLLRVLSVNAGRVLTHEQLLRQVWGHERYVEKGTVRTFVKRLRRKLGDDAANPRYIFAEPRVGYRMARSDYSCDNSQPNRASTKASP